MPTVEEVSRLRRARKRSGLTQNEVAEQLAQMACDADSAADLNVNGAMVSTWERGTKKPCRTYRRLLCALFHETEE